MSKIIILIILLLLPDIQSGKPNADALLKEGKLLYHLEKASWYATDLLLETFPDKMQQISGYLSYNKDEDHISTIFYGLNQNGKAQILTQYTFGANPDPVIFTLDSISREPIKSEIDLINLKSSALDIIRKNEDDFFTFYKKTSLNLIPVISNGKKKVFVLTAPTESGFVLLGNDYLLTFTRSNKIKSKKKLHNSLIKLPNENADKIILTTMHTHVLSNHIEPTDICTLLLYKDFVSWKQHYVLHKDYVSILDLDKEDLIIMKKENFEKIGRQP